MQTGNCCNMRLFVHMLTIVTNNGLWTCEFSRSYKASVSEFLGKKYFFLVIIRFKSPTTLSFVTSHDKRHYIYKSIPFTEWPVQVPRNYVNTVIISILFVTLLFTHTHTHTHNATFFSLHGIYTKNVKYTHTEIHTHKVYTNTRLNINGYTSSTSLISATITQNVRQIYQSFNVFRSNNSIRHRQNKYIHL